MKNMPFLLQRSKRRSRIGITHVAGVLVIVLALFTVLTRPQWFDRFLLDAGSILASAKLSAVGGVDKAGTGFTSREEMAEENRVLREENLKLRLHAALYEEHLAEYARLRSRFGRETTFSGTLAHITSAPDASPYDTVILDVGTKDGIAVGDEVWFDTTVHVGFVETAGSYSSRARLFSSPGYEQQVIIGTSSALYTAVGQGGGMLELLVPRDISVAEDNTLRKPGNFAGVVGFVREVSFNDTDPEKVVRATLPVNLFEMREVLVRSVPR